MKKILAFICLILLSTTVIGCTGENVSQGSGSANNPNGNSSSALGKYEVLIDSCRLAEDYDGKPVIIVKFKFTNNDDDPKSFMWAFNYKAYQNGIGLNDCYFLADSANYSSENKSKEIKKGASIFVESAYTLNDTSSDVEIEVSELISYNKKVIKKIFSIK